MRLNTRWSLHAERRPAALWAWLAALWLALSVLAPAALAQRVEGDRAGASGIYEAEVPVNNQTEAERRNGMARAMAQVLAKITGDRTATARPGVGQELRRAEEFVEDFSYRQDQAVGAGGVNRFSTMLVVRFDRARIEGIVAALGLPVWPEPRPRPVLWLAIDDGKGPRLVGVGQSNAARSILDRAIERGYRLGLPNGNAAEQAAAGAIWRGDTAAVARLSSAYSPPMQLIGKLYRKGSGWKADWIFVDGGKVLGKWSSENADARRAMAGGADGGADALIRRYARRSAAAGPAGMYRVRITGVDSPDDYIRLSAHLQELAVVRRIRPIAASGSTLMVELDLQTGLPGFRRLIQSRGILVGVDGDATPAGTPDAGGQDTVPTFDLR